MTIRLGDPAAGIVLGRDTIDPGLGGLPAALRESVLWLDSRYSKAGEPRVINRGTGDRTGVSGAVIYDGALVLPGVAGNYLSVPDEAALDITGDIELVTRAALPDYSPAATNGLFGKFANSNRDYWWELTSAGNLKLGTSADGTTLRDDRSTATLASLGLVDGATYWFKVTRAAASGNVNFYYAADSLTEPSSWTQIGATVAGTAGAIHAGTAALWFGALSGSVTYGTGSIYRGIIRDGIDGTTVLDVDLSTANNWASSFTATTGQTVTLNTTAADYGAPSALDAKYGSVLGAYVYDGAAVLPGLNSNYLSVPDEAALDVAGDFSAIFTIQPDAYPWGKNQTFFSKYDTNTNWTFTIGAFSGATAIYARVTGDGSTIHVNKSVDFAGLLQPGVMSHVGVTYDADNGASGNDLKFWHSTDGVSWSQVGATQTTATARNPHVSTARMVLGASWGASGGGGEEVDGEMSKWQLFDGIGANTAPGQGTTVLDVDLANVADYATSFTATTGQTVTVNSTSADTNDPLLLTHTGENYAYLPITTSNSLSTPDEAALNITGDLELIIDCALPDWTPSTNQYIFSKHGGGSSGGFEIQLNSSLGLILNYADSGVGSYMRCPNPVPFANGERGAIKVTFDVDDGAGNRVARFYTADTAAGPWTLLGTDTDVGTVTLDTNALALYVGSRTTATSQGYYYNAIVKDGIDGTTVFDFNAATDITDAGATSFTATSGQAVTVNRATSGRKTALVTRPVWLFGTDDMFRIEDNALLDFDAATDSTILVVRRSHATLPAGAGILQKVNTVSPFPSYAMRSGGSDPEQLVTTVKDTAGAAPSGGGANSTTNQIIYGDLQVLGQLRDRSVPEHKALINNTIYGAIADDTNGDLSNNGPLNIGVSDSVYADQELVAVAIWRRALTTDEIAAINTYYGTA